MKQIVVILSSSILAVLTATSCGLPKASSSACPTTTKNGQKVDGTSLWGTVPMAEGQRSATDCDVDQFAWNNFLYMTSDDGNGHPRFMSLAPWFDAMPEKGEPVWPGSYTPLSNMQAMLDKNQIQAGDDFQLLDVNGKTVMYDIRINEDFLMFLKNSPDKLYTKEGIKKAAAAFKKNASTGGIWLPPTELTSKKSALEMKTSWRDYGSTDGACPSDIMHCEKDTAGKWWGLIGMHLVQKTPQHGEMIWASFEHVANSPDCGPGGTNPVQQNPGDLNANKNIPSLKDQTGWNLFNYSTYKTAGGDGKQCTYPQTSNDGKTQCLTDPNPSGTSAKPNWISVNSCRTDQLPKVADCSKASENLDIASCLNESVHSSISNKWKHYVLIGAEYVFWGSTGTGAPLVGCWNFEDGNASLKCQNDPSGEISVTRRGTTNLANTTMETWMQKGISLKTASLDWTLTQQDCFSCHQPVTTTYQGDMSHLFGRAQQ